MDFMKSLKFTPDNFRFVRLPGVDDYEDCLNISIRANKYYRQWMTQFLAEMQSYTQGMSVLSEEPFKEFMKDFCEEWRI